MNMCVNYFIYISLQQLSEILKQKPCETKHVWWARKLGCRSTENRALA